MTLQELVSILNSTGLPVAHSHFKNTESSPAPSPPFITYLDDGSANFFADNKVYVPIKNPTVELYTDKKDLSVEQKLETALNDNGLPFELEDEVWIESERLFQQIYNITL
ncbi:hypothetical protein SAMN05421676_102361 [Salinibacillus kushneri]|uniref:Uncharacterized protein n=1 Tax=Salinibacillus kushneri TaxID=237682 RepID=A0A1I0B819_9BACI|nr:hypothetical protein [Salinibacillus kushneri]SET02286.1 hypothetical protein SAMN05421676_102361 [Salinibacillus kushneri]